MSWSFAAAFLLSTVISIHQSAAQTCDSNCLSNNCTLRGEAKCDGGCATGYVLVADYTCQLECDPRCLKSLLAGGCDERGGGKCDALVGCVDFYALTSIFTCRLDCHRNDFVLTPVNTCGCSRPLDLVLIFDSGKTIHDSVNLASNIVRHLTVSPNGTHVAAIAFFGINGSKPFVFFLNTYITTDTVDNELGYIYMRSGKIGQDYFDFSEALALARNDVFSESNGARQGNEVIRIALMFTSGGSISDAAVNISHNMRAEGVRLMAVTLRSTVLADGNLLKIVNSPDNLIIVENTGDYDNATLAGTFVAKACTTVFSPSPSTTRVTTTDLLHSTRNATEQSNIFMVTSPRTTTPASLGASAAAHEGETDSTVALAVGISVGVSVLLLALLAVIIAVICVRKRRLGRTHQKKRERRILPSGLQCDGISEPAYEEVNGAAKDSDAITYQSLNCEHNRPPTPGHEQSAENKESETSAVRRNAPNYVNVNVKDNINALYYNDLPLSNHDATYTNSDALSAASRL